jgi:hypothetical protein
MGKNDGNKVVSDNWVSRKGDMKRYNKTIKQRTLDKKLIKAGLMEPDLEGYKKLCNEMIEVIKFYAQKREVKTTISDFNGDLEIIDQKAYFGERARRYLRIIGDFSCDS